jgi:DNA-directed RNA polymerase omega subunit
MNRLEIGNAFEFVAVASARARQLLRGCPPRLAGGENVKPVRLAQQEVLAGLVRRVEGETPGGETSGAR